MSLDVVTGKHLEELVLRVQDGVKQKEEASLSEKCHPFHLVFVAGIAGRFAEACCRIQHKAVVHTNRFHGCAARQNGFAAATVSAEVMVNDRTSQDNVVDVAEMLIDPNRSSAGSRTEVLKVFLLVAETVVHLQTRSNVLANCLNHFFFCHRTMCPQGEDDVHIIIFDAELIHLIDEDRHEIKAVCDAGRIVADESNFLARFNDFVDRRTPIGW